MASSTTKKLGRDLQVGDVVIDPAIGYHPVTARTITEVNGITHIRYGRGKPFAVQQTVVSSPGFGTSRYNFTADQTYTVLSEVKA